jgi:serine/threonine-protein kinase HipA
MSGYRVTDELFLWWLGRPKSPVPIGTLRLLRQSQGVSLRYFPQWLGSGFSLSEDLPLGDTEHRPSERDTAAGSVDDARPDRWGERIIRYIEKPPRLSLLEYLYFAGDERFGALGVSVSADAYLPHRTGPLPTLGDVEEMQELVSRVIANQPVPDDKRRLIAPGTTLGGARPKALITMEAAQWLVKFGEDDDAADIPLIEHACMTLAEKARIRVAQTRAIPAAKRHAIAVLRFDRAGTAQDPRRVHAHSARVALRAEGNVMGYPELAQLLRRRGPTQGGVAREQMRELFRRMVFNVLMDNTDDHEKNHVLLVDERQYFHLAPAFDLLPTGQALGYQQMRVGRDGSDATVDNALSEAVLFGMSRNEATKEAAAVGAVCANWKAHFGEKGVTRPDIETLAQYVDCDFLVRQRADLAAQT